MISSPVEKIVAKLLIDYGNNINSGNSHLDSEQCTNILSAICHIEMTKPEVCEYLNISRSRFDDLVREHRLPKGRPSKHRNNLVWYKDEIISVIDNS